MSTTPSESRKPAHEIPGYALKHRLGVGGYGEVWAAEAPGGLTKAVKIVYGYHDEERAQSELASLEKIKQLRHPFLISLERIDIVDGRLVIISELADNCMRDRFRHYRENDHTGIPREELISNLMNVAEALDYLSNDHSLQHLDIKPENLLYVGTHVKVADFGLVKSFQEGNHSILEGLTPTYSAPELFDGKPTRNSDQYSLAIVYQEMLTGTRPFSGSTMTQLANQHIGSRPNLMVLPQTDQPVIARALAKEHEQRYPDCRTMIEDLARRKPKNRTQVSSPGFEVEDGSATQLVDVETTKHVVRNKTYFGAQTIHAEVEKLPPLAVDGNAEIRPTIFVGVGRTGGKILASIKSQLFGQIGMTTKTPSIRFLYIDTDRRDLFDATASANDCNLEHFETLEIPLQSREYYRNSKKDFSWLSRRWLFNVPKSTQTEGLRPLGRLALADNFDSVCARLKQNIEDASKAENLAATAETLKMNPGEDLPQVFVVGSSAGGTSSGAVLDITFALKSILASQGFDEDQVAGCFVHSTNQANDAEQLAIVNTYSFLSEYNHYCLRGYTGDRTIDLAEFEPGPVFSHLYFKDLGERLSDSDYETAISSVGKYLYLSSVSNSNHVFAECRKSDGLNDVDLRSFGISSAGGGLGEIVKDAVHGLAEKLIDYWKGDACEGQSDQFRQEAEQTVVSCGLSVDNMDAHWKAIDERLWPEGLEKSVTEYIHTCVQQITSQQLSPIDAAQFVIAAMEDFSGAGNEPPPKSYLHLLLNSILQHSQLIANAIHDRAVQLVNTPGKRIGGAQLLVCSIQELLLQSLESYRNYLTQLQHQHQESCALIPALLANYRKSHKNPADQSAVLTQLGQIGLGRLQIVKVVATIKLLESTNKQVESLRQQIADISEQLVLVNESFQAACGSSLLESMNTDFQKQDLIGGSVVRLIQSQYDEMAATVDQRFSDSVAEDQSLFQMLTDHNSWLRDLPDLIKNSCQDLIVAQLQDVSLDGLVQASEFEDFGLNNWIDVHVSQANPKIDHLGGSIRMVVSVPQIETSSHMTGAICERSGFTPTVIDGAFGDCIFCFEVNHVPLDNVAIGMIDTRSDCAELVARLHTRNDVQWINLTQIA